MTTPAMRIVQNLQRDTKHFHPVYNTDDGLAPRGENDKPITDEKALRKLIKEGEGFKLDLGSPLDDNEQGRAEKALKHRIEIPLWAVKKYRETVPLFNHFEAEHAISVINPG